MPEGYVAAFDEATRAVHAGIVARRGAGATHLETWEELADGVVGICVVADDRPGLLSRICAALVAHDLDIVAAQAFGRERPDGEMEAVDFLWIRRVPQPDGTVTQLDPKDVVRIGETLDALVRGRASFERTVSFTRAVRAAHHATRVRFVEGAESTLVLTVEAIDHPGLLLAVTSTLFRERVQIVASRVTTSDKRAHDRFVVAELDGKPLERERQLAVQTAVLEAIEALG
jgi:UTP:GlnB (protein PII) uridylyltransferase